MSKKAKSFNLTDENVAIVGFTSANRGTINREDLNKMKLSELVDIHNANVSEEHGVKSFKSKEVGAEETWAAITANCANVLSKDEEASEVAEAHAAGVTPFDPTKSSRPDGPTKAEKAPKEPKAPKAPKEPKPRKGMDLKPAAVVKAVRAGTNQHKILELIARKEGANVAEMQKVIGPTRENPIAPEASIKAILSWDLNKQKGYGVRAQTVGDEQRYFLVLPEGIATYPQPTSVEQATKEQKQAAKEGREKAKKHSNQPIPDPANPPANPAPPIEGDEVKVSKKGKK
jgi:hypothetical protein